MVEPDKKKGCTSEQKVIFKGMGEGGHSSLLGQKKWGFQFGKRGWPEDLKNQDITEEVAVLRISSTSAIHLGGTIKNPPGKSSCLASRGLGNPRCHDVKKKDRRRCCRE